MSLFMMSVAGVLALALAWWLLRRPAAKAGPAPAAMARRSSLPAQRPATPQSPAPREPAPTALEEPLPPALRDFHWLYERDLDPARRETLVAAVRGIPRPPRSLQQLLSPEFVAKAGSAELAELVMGEPLIAARVLSTVNSPLYGLRQPVTSIGQAVTFLGMNTVRSICLQYMLADAFKPKDAETQRCFDAIWRASAIASELCVRLGKALNLPDQGSLATQVVLSFVGQLATASLIPASGLRQWLSRGRLERARIEQELLGLSANEIGCLLMRAWDLPAALIDDVGAVGRQLITPFASSAPQNAPRLALAYLCARLGERLAMGDLPSLDGYDPRQDTGPDTHHLRAGLTHPALAKLNQALAGPELLAAVDQMLGNTPLAA